MTKRQHPKPQYKKCSPNPKTQTPKHKNQWHFIHWCLVRGIMNGYQIKTYKTQPIYSKGLFICDNFAKTMAKKQRNSIILLTNFVKSWIHLCTSVIDGIIFLGFQIEIFNLYMYMLQAQFVVHLVPNTQAHLIRCS